MLSGVARNITAFIFIIIVAIVGVATFTYLCYSLIAQLRIVPELEFRREGGVGYFIQDHLFSASYICVLASIFFVIMFFISRLWIKINNLSIIVLLAIFSHWLTILFIPWFLETYIRMKIWNFFVINASFILGGVIMGMLFGKIILQSPKGIDGKKEGL